MKTPKQLKKRLLEHIFQVKLNKLKLPCDVANSHILGEIIVCLN